MKGNPPMEKTREELMQSKDELLNRLEAIRKDLRGGLDADSKEQAVQLENMQVLQEIARVTEENLQEINKQLSAFQEDD
jgi:RNA polymerase-binding transcription factor DksA